MFARSSRGACIFVCALAAAALLSCSDRPDPSSLSGSSQRQLPLRPRFVVLGADSSLPINRIRLTAKNHDTGEIIGTYFQPVDPNAAEWKISIEVITGGKSVNADILIELVNESPNGVVEVQWSGSTNVNVTPSQSNTVSEVPIYRGPPENLTISSININEPLPALEEDARAQLSALTVGSTAARVFWSSLDNAVATITVDGALTAHLPGTARIVAVAGAHADTVLAIVTQKLAAVQLTPSAGLLESFGTEFSYTAKAVDRRGGEMPNTSIGWSTSDSTIAPLVGVGRFRALKNGKVTVSIFARSDPSIKSTGTMTVAQRIKTITIDPDELSFSAVGASRQLTATATDANSNKVTDAVFTWSSSDNGVATVDAAGRVTVKGAGAALIKVRAAAVPSAPGADTVNATIPVAVQQKESAVEVEPSSVDLTAVGDTVRLRALVEDANGNEVIAPKVTWSSVVPSIADVDANGLVTAKSLGSVVIQATVGTIRAFATVNVKQTVTAVLVSPDTITLTSFAKTVQLYARPVDRNKVTVPDLDVEWLSSDTTIAKVDSDGLVTPRANGVVKIEAEAAEVDGYATITINVPVTETFTLASGNNQRGRPASMLASPLVVRLRDGSGRGIAGRVITWVITAGGGYISPPTSTTDTAGYARAYLSLGSRQEMVTVEARLSGLPAVVFSAEASVLPTATITWTGAVSSSWKVPGNWSPVRVPNAGDTVSIRQGTPNVAWADTSATVAVVLVDGGTALNIPGYTLRATNGAFGRFAGEAEVEVGGAPDAFVGGSFPSLRISGPAHLVSRSDAAWTTVTAPLTFNGQRLNTSGVTVDGGTISMVQIADTLAVQGNLDFYSTPSGSSTLSSGVILVGGDFSAGCGVAFPSVGTELILNGTSDQSLNLHGGDCDDANQLADFVVNKSGGQVYVAYGHVPMRNFTISTPTSVGGECWFLPSGNVQTVAGSSIGCPLYIGGSAGTTLIAGGVPDYVELHGHNQTISTAHTYNSLLIQGTAQFDGPASLTGALTIRGDTSSLTLAGATEAHEQVEITDGGSLILNGNTFTSFGPVYAKYRGTFTMHSSADQLIINDNPTYALGDLIVGTNYPGSGSDFSGKLTAGTIRIRGQLTSFCSGQPGFRVDGTAIVFAGTAEQVVAFACADAASQYLGNVDIITGTNVKVIGPLLITGNLAQHGMLTVDGSSVFDVMGSVHLFNGSTTNNNGSFRLVPAALLQDAMYMWTGNPWIDRNPT